MTLEDGLNLSVWRGVLFDQTNANSVSLLYRLMWLADAHEREGLPYRFDEAGRPRGVPEPDERVGRLPPDGRVDLTASGLSTMYFQHGRMQAGYTPSAVDPRNGTSPHTRGTAVDMWAANRSRQYELAAAVGLYPTIRPSEPWHLDTLGNPAGWIDFSIYNGAVDEVFGRTPPAPPKPKLTATVTRRRR